MKNNNTRLILDLLGIGSFTITLYSFHKENNRAKEFNEHVESSVNGLKTAYELAQKGQAESIKDKHMKSQVGDWATGVKSHLQSNLEQVNNLVEKANNEPTLAGKEKVLKESFEVVQNGSAELDKLAQKLIDIVKNNYINNDYTFSLDYFVNYFNGFNEYLLSLSLVQKFALIHVIGSLLVIYSALSIIGVLFGNSIITNLKIEERYPRLKKILELRLKFQRYYLIWDFSIIFFVMFGVLLTNLKVILI